MNELISLGRVLWDNGEPGFFEIKTHKILSKKFRELEFVIQEFRNIPGFIASIDGSYETKPIALISDMDALPLPGDPGGKYIHSCGHHVQMTALFGTAFLLKKEDPELLNKIIFIAIPAEEYIDFDKREKLIKETADDLNIEFIEEQYSSASSDVGNISQIKPTVMLGLPGVNGKFHNPDFRVTNETAAYVFPSQFLVEYIRKVADSLPL